jgi:polyhydroxyalkanoate synthesis regulator phasin
MSDTAEPSRSNPQGPERPSNRAIEEAVTRTLRALRLPRRDQLLEAASRIEQLEARIAALEEEGKR